MQALQEHGDPSSPQFEQKLIQMIATLPLDQQQMILGGINSGSEQEQSETNDDDNDDDYDDDDDDDDDVDDGDDEDTEAEGNPLSKQLQQVRLTLT